MKHYGLIYENYEQLKNFTECMKRDSTDQMLIQIFTGIIQKDYIDNLTGSLKELIPNSRIIGLTTTGEIFGGKILEKKTIITFLIFEKARVETILLENSGDEYRIGEQITENIVFKDTKLIFLFSDGLFTDGFDIIKAIQDFNKEITVCGGKAGDNEKFQNTYVFTEEGVLSRGIAAVSISGEELYISTQYSFCWSTIGKKMTITKALKNRIYTIDDIPAIEIYKKYLGFDIVKNLPLSAVEFPLIIRKNGIGLARVAEEAYDDGSLKVLGNVQTGDEIQFGYGNVDMILEKSLEVVKRFYNQPIDLFFVYTCYVRKRFLQNNIELEIAPLNNIAPCYGYFTYGEYLTTDCYSGVFNVTTQMIGISEKKSEAETVLKDSVYEVDSRSYETRELDLIQVFSHLANQAICELREANEILEKQKCEIERMRKAADVVTDINNQILYSCKPEKLYDIILDKVLEVIPGARMGAILSSENGYLQYNAARGYNPDYVRNTRYDIKKSRFFSRYKEKGMLSPIIIDLDKELKITDPELTEIYHKILVEKPNELLTCGIKLDEDNIALINIFTGSEQRFSEEDGLIIRYMADEISMVFKNTEYLENVLYLSRHDRLTGAYSRSYLIDYIHELKEKCMADNGSFIICLLDLNNFKDINDSFGHDIGDLYLIKLTAILKNSIDKEDFLGRVGGDEFEIVFTNKTREQVQRIMDQILERFKASPFVFNNFSREIKFAYGLAEFPKDSWKIHSLIKIADSAMYRNKKDSKMDIYQNNEKNKDKN